MCFHHCFIIQLEVVPMLFGNNDKIVAKRYNFNHREMSEKLERFVCTTYPSNLPYVEHEKVYIVKHNGRYKRAMLKFRSITTSELCLTLLDETGSLIKFRKGNLEGNWEIYNLQSEILAKEMFGLMKIQIYGLESIDKAAAARIFETFARGTKCNTVVQIQNVKVNPVNYLYVGDLFVQMPNGKLRSLRELLIQNGAATANCMVRKKFQRTKEIAPARNCLIRFSLYTLPYQLSSQFRNSN